jgi:hypothetical protein
MRLAYMRFLGRKTLIDDVFDAEQVVQLNFGYYHIGWRGVHDTKITKGQQQPGDNTKDDCEKVC